MLCSSEGMPTKSDVHRHCLAAVRRQRKEVGDRERVRPAWYAEAWRMLDPCERRRLPRVGEIVSAAASYFDVSPQDIISQRRSQRIVLARQVAMYVARETTLHSFPAIGRCFGDRDHTTVISNCRAIERRKQSDPKLNSAIAAIEREVGR